jgi:Animal haem peroxidase
MRQLVVTTIISVIVSTVLLASTIEASDGPFTQRSLDGGDNNVRHPAWGQANTEYLRVAAPNYADGLSTMVSGPPARYVSDRVFNDVGQNLFSENGVTQFVWTWGQFMDHDFGLRDETPGASVPIPFKATDPLEVFHNDFGVIDFNRTPAAPGSGIRSPRQQINTNSSYIDASGIYGGTTARLDWLRVGPVDGDPANNSARLLLSAAGYLPRADARGDAAAAPVMDLMGALVATPAKAVVAGDVRANENIALTAMHTLFAREHNRIVASLPRSLSEQQKFDIARRVVGAELQYITYTEFLPAVGVHLDPYRGYDPRVNAGLANEFATVGYRAHSMIHGGFDAVVPANQFTPAQLQAFGAQGLTIEDNGDGTITISIPLTVAFGNPDLLESVGLKTLLSSLTDPQYKNDEQIDNSLRSVLFQVPTPGTPDPSVCGAPVIDPSCFTGVVDLGAIDVQRGRDHGMPSYNDLRKAYGLDPKRSFTDITGESTQRFPSDPLINSTDPINDPNILDFVQTFDAAGNVVPLGSEEGAVVGVRRTTLAARLKAIYGDVDHVDAFVGLVSERHVRGTEFGELQLAMWTKQFEALRDGDRFYSENDPALRAIERDFNIDYRHTLSQIIRANTGLSLQADVFTGPSTRPVVRPPKHEPDDRSAAGDDRFGSDRRPR